MVKRRFLVLGVFGAVAGTGLLGVVHGQGAHNQGERLLGVANIIRGGLRSRRTVDEVVAAYGPAARARLAPGFDAAGIAYPPATVTMIGLKAERRLEIWAPGAAGRPAKVADYPVMAASGGPGPKLREGDRQVPEGFYPITFLNANSAYHLSLRIGYPGDEDRALAAAEGRSDLGGDIMIHGAGGSRGCLALANDDVEDVFVLAADVGIPSIRVILAPHDLRGRPVPPVPPGAPAWTADRYRALHAAMAAYV